MARGDMDVTIRQEVRPCIVPTLNKSFDGVHVGYFPTKALWHMWMVRGDHLNGLVELEDGTTLYVPATEVRFLDGSKMFAEYDWPEEKSPEDKVWDDIREGKGISREI